MGAAPRLAHFILVIAPHNAACACIAEGHATLACRALQGVGSNGSLDRRRGGCLGTQKVGACLRVPDDVQLVPRHCHTILIRMPCSARMQGGSGLRNPAQLGPSALIT